jgi:hypothetical protein
MFSHLLKRVIPFTLTFILGATIGGFFKMFRTGETRSVGVFTSYRAYEYNYGMGRGCDHHRNLVAESKPLVILFKPDARWPRGLLRSEEGVSPVRVRVTFGADGKVQQVEPGSSCVIAAQQDWSATSKEPGKTAVWAAVERAARQIQFEPETINSIPVSVTKDVEIRFIGD